MTLVSSAPALALALVLGLGACKKEQTFEEAMHEACEYPERPEVRAKLDSLPVEERATALVKLVMPRITNPEAKKLFGTVTGSRAETEALMQSAVKRAGITKCWMTDPPVAPAPSAR